MNISTLKDNRREVVKFTKSINAGLNVLPNHIKNLNEKFFHNKHQHSSLLKAYNEYRNHP